MKKDISHIIQRHVFFLCDLVSISPCRNDLVIRMFNVSYNHDIEMMDMIWRGKENMFKSIFSHNKNTCLVLKQKYSVFF